MSQAEQQPNQQLLSTSDLERWFGVSGARAVEKRLEAMNVKYWKSGKNNGPITLLSNIQAAGERIGEKPIQF